jgi:hypothetical protein
MTYKLSFPAEAGNLPVAMRSSASAEDDKVGAEDDEV